jgi:hypothetical protein
MSFLDWLNALARDADAAAPGFQAQPVYLVACVAGPMLFGALVGSLLAGIERLFGIKLSSRGGH